MTNQKPITIEIRGEPVGKAAKIKTRWSTYLPDKTATWMALVRQRAQLVAPPEPFTCPVRVDIEARLAPAKAPKWKREAALAGHVRPGKKPDIDNVHKGIADACTGVIWRDDALIVEGHQRKVYSLTPGVTIIVTPLPEPTSAEEWREWCAKTPSEET